MTTSYSTPSRRAPRQAAADHEFLGLSAITIALAAILHYRPDRATVGRWLAVGVRGHRIAGRRIGHRWATTRAALTAWAIASGAIPEGDR